MTRMEAIERLCDLVAKVAKFDSDIDKGLKPCDCFCGKNEIAHDKHSMGDRGIVDDDVIEFIEKSVNDRLEEIVSKADWIW